ncbi:MAG: hypothetical protein N5P05_002713 [Chroococcopsis gigantea SAG 12.99]|jgi:hypothetical protein|nr:hypothetical protein [Chroococcopsis gigantea SAG 12.99]
MSGYTALLDANILYPAPMRDLFLQLAVTDLFRARWTVDIHSEWIEALLRNQPSRNRADLEKTRDKMNQATRDCLIDNYRDLIPSLELPDPDDRHVLAAAIVGRCDVIVTQNIRDFPEDIVGGYGLDLQHPDQFLCNQLDLAPGLFCNAVKKIRARLKKPPLSVKEYLANLTHQGLVATVAELEQFSDLL